LNKIRIPVSISNVEARQIIEQLRDGLVYPLEDLTVVSENVASQGRIYLLMGARLISLEKGEPIKDMREIILEFLGMSPYIMTITFQCGTVYKINPTEKNNEVSYKYYPPKREGVN